MKFCDYCGKGYELLQKRQRFCSKHCSRKWWKEHPPIHSDPPGGAEVLRTFECKLCRKEVKVKEVRSVDKAEIRKQLKEGLTIPGAELTECQNIQIK